MKTKLFKTLLLAALALSLMAPVLNRWQPMPARPGAVVDAATNGPKPGTTGFAPGAAFILWC